jgi:hypothetical protein
MKMEYRYITQEFFNLRSSVYVGILPQYYTVSQPEDGGSMDLWNVDILPQHYTVSQPEDGGSMDLSSVGILQH